MQGRWWDWRGIRLVLAQLKHKTKRLLEELLEMGGGYVLDFSNRTFEEFFEDFGISIYSDKYSGEGDSKANRMRSFVAIERSDVVEAVIRELWQHRCDLVADRTDYGHLDQNACRRKFEQIINALQEKGTPAFGVELEKTATLLNFDTVRRDLDKAMASLDTDPEKSLTASCSLVESVCRSILVELGKALPAKKDIKSLFNAVREPLGLHPNRTDLDPTIAKDVQKVMSGLASVVDGIGALRTHGGDAHGRERGFKRIDTRIANLAIQSSSTIALFLIETWQRKYPDRVLRNKTEVP